MAMIDTPWLRDRNRDFIGEGVQTGLALGNMYLRSIAQKQEMEQNAKEFPLRIQGLALEQQVRDAQLRSAQQEMQHRSTIIPLLEEKTRLDLERQKVGASEALKADADRVDWYRTLSAIRMPEVAPEEREALFWQRLSEKPWLRDDPATIDFVKDLDAEKQFRSLEERARIMAESREKVATIRESSPVQEGKLTDREQAQVTGLRNRINGLDRYILAAKSNFADESEIASLEAMKQDLINKHDAILNLSTSGLPSPSSTPGELPVPFVGTVKRIR